LVKLKKNYFLIIITLLALYFSVNLLGGQRGLFAYMEKKENLHKLQTKEIEQIEKINDLEHKNSLLSDNLDSDYIDILIREKFVLGKKDEKTYILVDNEN